MSRNDDEPKGVPRRAELVTGKLLTDAELAAELAAYRHVAKQYRNALSALAR